jgi:Aromatic-ring-opening dioxygenase LigAB, LigA subunit
VSDEPHYTFPPAAAYRLNRCLHAIKSDSAYCARFLADPAAAMDELGLGAEERAALSPIDRDVLVGRGAHPYLVFMAVLRLRMAREPGTLEHF